MQDRTDSTPINSRPQRSRFTASAGFKTTEKPDMRRRKELWVCPKPCTHAHNELNLSSYGPESNHGQLFHPNGGSSAHIRKKVQQMTQPALTFHHAVLGDLSQSMWLVKLWKNVTDPKRYSDKIVSRFS